MRKNSRARIEMATVGRTGAQGTSPSRSSVQEINLSLLAIGTMQVAVSADTIRHTEGLGHEQWEHTENVNDRDAGVRRGIGLA